MTENYVLATNGGGGTTATLCADVRGNVVGQGNSGPCSLAVTSIGAASFNLRESARQATENLPADRRILAMVVGVSGLDTMLEYQTALGVFAQALSEFKIEQLLLVNDAMAVLAAGTQRADALVIVSGTGSNCVGRNSEGQQAKTGGMDYLLTDQGSGYMIGRQVLREAVKSYDGRRPKSLLERLVCEHFKINSIAELKDKVYNPPLSKTEIAGLSSIGLRALEQNDPVAKAIYDTAIGSLVSMATTVIQRLGLAGRTVDCVVAGSVMQTPYVLEHFSENISFVCPQITIIKPDKEPVYGSLNLAIGVVNSIASRNSV